MFLVPWDDTSEYPPPPPPTHNTSFPPPRQDVLLEKVHRQTKKILALERELSHRERFPNVHEHVHEHSTTSSTNRLNAQLQTRVRGLESELEALRAKTRARDAIRRKNDFEAWRYEHEVERGEALERRVRELELAQVREEGRGKDWGKRAEEVWMNDESGNNGGLLNCGDKHRVLGNGDRLLDCGNNEDRRGGGIVDYEGGNENRLMNYDGRDNGDKRRNVMADHGRALKESYKGNQSEVRLMRCKDRKHTTTVAITVSSDDAAELSTTRDRERDVRLALNESRREIQLLGKKLDKLVGFFKNVRDVVGASSTAEEDVVLNLMIEQRQRARKSEAVAGRANKLLQSALQVRDDLEMQLETLPCVNDEDLNKLALTLENDGRFGAVARFVKIAARQFSKERYELLEFTKREAHALKITQCTVDALCEKLFIPQNSRRKCTTLEDGVHLLSELAGKIL